MHHNLLAQQKIRCEKKFICCFWKFSNRGLLSTVLHFQVEMHPFSFGLHAFTISYALLLYPAGARYHLTVISQMRLSISLAWHWVNLSHTSKRYFGNEIGVEATSLSASISPCRLCLPLFHLQLTVTKCRCIVHSSWQPIPCSSSIFLTPNYLPITLEPSGVGAAHVKVMPCEKTPVCLLWPPAGSGATRALQLTWCRESAWAPSGRAELRRVQAAGFIGRLGGDAGWCLQRRNKTIKRLRWSSEADLRSQNKDITHCLLLTLRCFLGRSDSS